MMKLWKSRKGFEKWLIALIISLLILVVILLFIPSVWDYISESVLGIFNFLGGPR